MFRDIKRKMNRINKDYLYRNRGNLYLFYTFFSLSRPPIIKKLVFRDYILYVYLNVCTNVSHFHCK